MPEPLMLKSIILIRRDNIGDLVCTTPAIRALRLTYPEIKIALLVNSYNADAVIGNPDIDEIFVYEKGKHRRKGGLGLLISNLRVLKKIRCDREKTDRREEN